MLHHFAQNEEMLQSNRNTVPQQIARFIMDITYYQQKQLLETSSKAKRLLGEMKKRHIEFIWHVLSFPSTNHDPQT